MSLLRELDEPIGPSEPLFRSIEPDDVAADDDARLYVRETAVDLRGTSVYRGKYCTSAEEALADSKRRRPHHTGIAATTPSNLPPKAPYNAVVWEVFAADDPDDSQFLAHAEVRVRRETDAPARECKAPNSASVKLELKRSIARQMHVEIDPTTGRFVSTPAAASTAPDGASAEVAVGPEPSPAV